MYYYINNLVPPYFHYSTAGAACEDSEIFGFLDGTLRRSCRQRGNDDLQRENYDGHHCAHGLSFQSVVLPNGMIGDLHGPESGRRHDSYLLRRSGLNPRLDALQAGHEFQGKVYGDAAYPILAHIDRGFRGANITDAQRTYNTELSRVRISVEWQFGKITSTFPFVDFQKKTQAAAPTHRQVLHSSSPARQRAHDMLRKHNLVVLQHAPSFSGGILPIRGR